MLQIDHGIHLVSQEEIKRIFPIETLLGTERQYSKESKLGVCTFTHILAEINSP